MKISKYIALFAMAGFTLSCSDPLEAPTDNVFVKTFDLGESAVTANAFQLDDGSVILMGWFLLTADILRIDPGGGIVWREVLPNSIDHTRSVIPLSNGNIFVSGFGLESGINYNHKEFSLMVYSPEGAVLRSAIFANNGSNMPSFDRTLNLYAKELSTGDVAVAMLHVASNSQIERVRLMCFDKDLNPTFDRIYLPDGIVPNLPVRQLSLDEDREGNLLIQGGIFQNLPVEGLVQPFAFVMKLDRENYDPVYFETYGDDWLTIPSTVAASTDGAAVWAYAGPSETNTSTAERFFHVPHFNHSLGTEITVLKTAGPEVEPQKVSIKGFPGFATAQHLRACSDGGYLLSGTCNFQRNTLISTDYRILVIKLDKDLRQEWMHIPNTYTGAFLNDASEIPGGFLVSATIHGPDGNGRSLIYKLDRNGNM